MPLIIVTGLPSSGKTTVSQKIHDYFERTLAEREGSTQTEIKLISDSNILDWDGRDAIFKSVAKSKEYRASMRTEAHRFIHLNQIVILDVAAIQKSFRYELNCIAKEAKTQYCVVETVTDKSICWLWNETRGEAKYGKQIFDELVFSYEKCVDTDRWDHPLFRASDSEEPDYSSIYRVIIEDAPLRPNKCTSLASSTATL